MMLSGSLKCTLLIRRYFLIIPEESSCYIICYLSIITPSEPQMIVFRNDKRLIIAAAVNHLDTLPFRVASCSCSFVTDDGVSIAMKTVTHTCRFAGYTICGCLDSDCIAICDMRAHRSEKERERENLLAWMDRDYRQAGVEFG